MGWSDNFFWRVLVSATITASSSLYSYFLTSSELGWLGLMKEEELRLSDKTKMEIQGYMRLPIDH